MEEDTLDLTVGRRESEAITSGWIPISTSTRSLLSSLLWNLIRLPFDVYLFSQRIVSFFWKLEEDESHMASEPDRPGPFHIEASEESQTPILFPDYSAEYRNVLLKFRSGVAEKLTSDSERQKIAILLVGYNGSGKSALLQALFGQGAKNSSFVQFSPGFSCWAPPNLPLEVFRATTDFEEDSFRKEASSFLSTQHIDIVFYTLDQTLGQTYGVQSCREMFAAYPCLMLLTKTDLVDESITSKLVQQINEEEGKAEAIAVILKPDARKHFTKCPECASEDLAENRRSNVITCAQCGWRGSTLPSEEEFGVSEVIRRVERKLSPSLSYSWAIAQQIVMSMKDALAEQVIQEAWKKQTRLEISEDHPTEKDVLLQVLVSETVQLGELFGLSPDGQLACGESLWHTSLASKFMEVVLHFLEEYGESFPPEVVPQSFIAAYGLLFYALLTKMTSTPMCPRWLAKDYDLAERIQALNDRGLGSVWASMFGGG